MKNDSTIYVGLDVHKESIVAAYAIDMDDVQSLGNIGVFHVPGRLTQPCFSSSSSIRLKRAP